ncbi:MAG TPA: TetR/AcrR family transcriptional regulator [Solirubrobacteraceae bacterium]|jgi:AcrR family transcriptional regulator|nr:TetR/AcrR family transcriptional regulator [Solirubrobacteraceae bacterium]
MSPSATRPSAQRGTALPAGPTRTRLSADQRREQILRAAVSEFSIGGLHGTSTEAIAQRAGISQPYLFRLFATKRALFIACLERCFERTLETFRLAADGLTDPTEALNAMGAAYVEMLADRELLLAQMQAYAASSQDDVRAVVRRHYEQLYEEVQRLSGADPEDVRTFFAHGMLLNVAAALQLPELGDPQSWAEHLRCPASERSGS